MISNERVQALIATDRDALIALMAAAFAAGSPFLTRWDVYLDVDIKALIDAAKAANAQPEPWQLIDERWKKR